MANEIELVVPDDLSGERVDKAIARLLDISRASSVTIVAQGVTIDGRRARGSDKVTSGAIISCHPPAVVTALTPEPVEFEVRYSDESVLVVDKPPGLVVHPGAGGKQGTLAAGLLYRYPELKGVGAADRWGLVHRLDKDTSGLLLVGRDRKAHQALTDQLRRREVVRQYQALVEGRLSAPTGTVDAPIGRDQARPLRRALSHTGKPARTHFEVTTYFPETDCSLIQVSLETGRTHQIRVHMASIGHPVVGDRPYGATRMDINTHRSFLHAARLTFSHPASGATVEVESPLPPDLTAVLETLGPSVSS